MQNIRRFAGKYANFGKNVFRGSNNESTQNFSLSQEIPFFLLAQLRYSLELGRFSTTYHHCDTLSLYQNILNMLACFRVTEAIMKVFTYLTTSPLRRQQSFVLILQCRSSGENGVHGAKCKDA